MAVKKKVAKKKVAKKKVAKKRVVRKIKRASKSPKAKTVKKKKTINKKVVKKKVVRKKPVKKKVIKRKTAKKSNTKPKKRGKFMAKEKAKKKTTKRRSVRRAVSSRLTTKGVVGKLQGGAVAAGSAILASFIANKLPVKDNRLKAGSVIALGLLLPFIKAGRGKLAADASIGMITIGMLSLIKTIRPDLPLLAGEDEYYYEGDGANQYLGVPENYNQITDSLGEDYDSIDGSAVYSEEADDMLSEV